MNQSFHRMIQPRKKQGGVRTLDRGLALLTCFDVAHPAWTLADLSRAVGLHKATTRRLVKTLEARQFLVMDESTGKYRLGPAIFPLTYIIRSNDELIRIARPFIEELAARTDESVGFWIWTETGIIQIDCRLTTRPFKPELLRGHVSREYGTAFSKLFLAFGQEERLSSLYWENDDQPLTVADATTVREELDRVRETGIAFDLEELNKGLGAVAAPVMDSAGDMVAAITVVVPAERFDLRGREAVASAARTTAEDLSRELGFKEVGGETVTSSTVKRA